MLLSRLRVVEAQMGGMQNALEELLRLQRAVVPGTSMAPHRFSVGEGVYSRVSNNSLHIDLLSFWLKLSPYSPGGVYYTSDPPFARIDLRPECQYSAQSITATPFLTKYRSLVLPTATWLFLRSELDQGPFSSS